MDLINIRLECLKLAHRADRDAADIIGRAKEFEEYLAPVPVKTVRPYHKKSGTPPNFEEGAD